jgi:hypothetical protein
VFTDDRPRHGRPPRWLLRRQQEQEKADRDHR